MARLSASLPFLLVSLLQVLRRKTSGAAGIRKKTGAKDNRPIPANLNTDIIFFIGTLRYSQHRYFKYFKNRFFAAIRLLFQTAELFLLMPEFQGKGEKMRHRAFRSDAAYAAVGFGNCLHGHSF
jgi:hypothetical protein